MGGRSFDSLMRGSVWSDQLVLFEEAVESSDLLHMWLGRPQMRSRSTTPLAGNRSGSGAGGSGAGDSGGKESRGDGHSGPAHDQACDADSGHPHDNNPRGGRQAKAAAAAPAKAPRLASQRQSGRLVQAAAAVAAAVEKP